MTSESKNTVMDLSIIIITYKTRELTAACLESIYRTVKEIPFEIVVVDNASVDGSAEYLKSKFPDINLIKNDRNLGFAAANNQALKMMKGRYALLLNSDTVLKESAVLELFSFMEKRPEAAMACGQLFNADGTKQNSIAGFPSLLTLLLNVSLLEYLLPEKFPSKRYEHDHPIEIDSGIGACLMVRKEAIDGVGMLDERYFFFMEETDWALRMREAGWKVFYVPNAFICHLQGQSIGQNIRSRIIFYRSRYIFFKKWKGPFYYRAVRSIILLRLALNWLFSAIACILTIGMNKNLNSKVSIYSQLLLWHLKGCPDEK